MNAKNAKDGLKEVQEIERKNKEFLQSCRDTLKKNPKDGMALACLRQCEPMCKDWEAKERAELAKMIGNRQKKS